MALIKLTSPSPDVTGAIGDYIGSLIRRPLSITLNGDLGSGKTVFVKGLAKGLGVPENYTVTSPTYTLINEYPGRVPLHHVDLYRMAPGDDFEEIGLYDLLDADGVVAIEWADRLSEELLPDRLAIRFLFSGDNDRNIHITAYGLEAQVLLERLSDIESRPEVFD